MFVRATALRAVQHDQRPPSAREPLLPRGPGAHLRAANAAVTTLELLGGLVSIVGMSLAGNSGEGDANEIDARG